MKQILVIIIAVLTLSAGATGILMIADPYGSLAGLKPEWLEGTPLRNYRWPGALMLLTITLPGILAIIDIKSDRRRAFRISFSFSLICIAWFLIQLLLVPDVSEISIFYLILSIMAILCSMQLMGKRAL